MSENTSIYGDAPEPQRVETPSLMDQFVGLLTEPTKLFQRLRQAPSWVPALILAIVIAVAASLIWAAKVDMAETARHQMETMKETFHMKIPDSAIEDAVSRQEGKHPWVQSVLGPLIGTPIIYLLIALIVWGCARMGTEENEEPSSFLQALSVTSVHYLVTIPSMLLAGVMCLIQTVGYRNIQQMSPTVLSFFVKPESGLVRGLFALVDPLWIFSFVLLAIGMRHTLKAKTWAIGLCLGFFALFGVMFRIAGGFFQ
jgi:Yip1 domain